MIEGQPIAYVAVKKREQHFVAVFTLGRGDDAIRQLIRWAQDKEMPFSWTDAANMAKAIAEQELGINE